MSFQSLQKPCFLRSEYLDRRGLDETVKPMTIALLHAQFGSLPTCRKRLQIKKIKDGASKTSIGEQGAPAGMLSVARSRCG
jgi:hypothetical protein